MLVWNWCEYPVDKVWRMSDMRELVWVENRLHWSHQPQASGFDKVGNLKPGNETQQSTILKIATRISSQGLKEGSMEKAYSVQNF